MYNWSRLGFLTVILLLAILGVSMSAQEGDNMVLNPGFENEGTEANNINCGWKVYKQNMEGEVTFTDDASRSGKKSLKIAVNQYTPADDISSGKYCIGASSELIPVTPSSKINISVYTKAQNISDNGRWHKLRVTVLFYSDRKTKLKHVDILCRDGSWEWEESGRGLIVPESAAFVKINCELNACTGTAWFDDIEVKKENPLELSDSLSTPTDKGPIIIPNPMRAVYSGKQILLTSPLNISGINDFPLVKERIFEYLNESGIKYSVSDITVIGKNEGSFLIIGNAKNEKLTSNIRKYFPDFKLENLGTQGYCIIIESHENNTHIYFGANTEQGHFYGLQTLKQLITKLENKSFSISEGAILDMPTIASRGISLGKNWFDNPASRQEAIKRMAQYKFNIVHIQGILLNAKLGMSRWLPGKPATWREPFTSQEERILSDFISLCRNNFIDVSISFYPLGTPHTQYSSDNDIDTIVNKMDILYKLGCRNFCINFDDSEATKEHVLITKEDIDTFGNDIGKAHCYFVKNIYERIKEKHPDIKFRFLPLEYGMPLKMTDKQRHYLEEVGKLPQGIEFISCPYDLENSLELAKLTKRLPIIWSNESNSWEGKNTPFFIPAIRPPTEFNETNISGYWVCPLVPKCEDGGVSWITAADYSWAPERYNSEASFQRAVGKIIGGVKNLESVKKYLLFAGEMDKMAVPKTNKENRLEWISKKLEQITEWEKELKQILPQDAFFKITKNMSNYRKELLLLKEYQEKRPYPIIAHYSPDKIIIDGNLNENAWSASPYMSGFVTFSGAPAVNQTSFNILYDAKNLYIAVICQEPEMGLVRANHNKRDSAIFEDDCVEVFMSKVGEPDNRCYYHFAINMRGAFYDAIMKHGHAFKEWDSEAQIATSKQEKSWTIEMAIPLKNPGSEPTNAEMLYNFNICRDRKGTQHETSSYALLFQGGLGFHKPNHFWTLQLANPEGISK